MPRTAEPSRRDDILKAARAVFDEKGFNDARMAEIAQKAGVASGTVYLYFKSKEELVNALCEDYLSRLNTKILAALDNPDGTQAVADAVHITLEFAQEERDLVKLLDLRAALGKRADMLPADRKMLSSLAGATARKIERGEIRDYDPQTLAEIISGMMEWVTKACLVWGCGDIERYEKTVIRLLQAALVVEKRKPSGFYMPLMW